MRVPIILFIFSLAERILKSVIKGFVHNVKFLLENHALNLHFMSDYNCYHTYCLVILSEFFPICDLCFWCYSHEMFRLSCRAYYPYILHF